MNTTRTKTITTAVASAIASLATPALLFFTAGSAQADAPACNLPPVNSPAGCTDQIAIPQPPSAQLAPGLSREWFRRNPIYRSQF